MTHASEARMRAILRSLSDATVVFDRDGTIRTAAPAAGDLFGLSPDVLPGRSFWDFVHPADLAAGLAEIARGFDVHRSATVEWRVRTGDGGWRWVEQALTDLSDNPTVDGVLAQLRDVSDRRALEDAQHESESRFQETFARTPIGAALIGANLSPAVVNEAFCRMLGYEAHELVGRPLLEWAHPEDQRGEPCDVERLLAGEIDRCRTDKRLVRKDGRELVGRITGWIVRDVDGRARYGIVTVDDVTEQAQTLDLLEDRERHLRLALSAAGIAVWDIDLRSGAAWVSSPSREALPVDGGELDTTLEHMVAVIHPDDRGHFERVLDDADPTQDEFDFDCRIRPHTATQPRWAHVKGQVLRDEHGVIERLVGITVDMEDRRRAEAEALEAAEVLRQTIAASTDAFLAIDGDGLVTRWNRAAESLFGYTAAEAVGSCAVELLVPAAVRDGVWATIQGFLDPDIEGAAPSWGFGPVEVQAVHRSGRELLIEASGARVEQAGAAMLHVFLRDATERQVVLEQLESGLLIDPLTSLPNRALLNDRLSSALARLDRSVGMVAVLFLDLDRFKVVNDALGHGAGDALLATVAARIRRALRPQDTVARFGGDEFVVVVEDLEAVDDILALADRLRVEIGRPVRVRDHQFHLGASIGISVATNPATGAMAMVRDADLAMYRAKARGGGTYELFDEDMRRAVVTRLELENDLRRAVEGDELEVYYQPVVRADGNIMGVEALVRWNHPTRGLITPAEFIPVAEEIGIISAIGTQVLEQACTTVAQWRALQPDLQVSVNLSVRQLTDRALPDLVAGILDRSGLPPEALCLELTETALMQDAVDAGTTLHRLRQRGVSLAVDDFGTGYSSLLYLRRFPVQVLKLDRYFVAGVADNAEDRAIIGAIIDLARALDLRCVAEGVETEEQRHALTELGCDYFQGHLFGRAVPAAVLEQALASPGSVATPIASARALRPVVSSPDGSGRRAYRAFLVDDAPGDRSLLRATLEGSGEFVVVGEAESGDEAIAAVTDAEPDVILVDLFLPGTDGLQLLEVLGSTVPHARSVIVSGYVSEGVAVAARAAGAVACLDKSLSPAALVDSLTSVLAGMRTAATG